MQVPEVRILFPVLVCCNIGQYNCCSRRKLSIIKLFASLPILTALPTASLQDSALHQLALSAITPFLEPNLAQQKALCCHMSDSPVLSSHGI